MFGRRPDGVAIDGSMDPITRVANYIMTERIDAQVFAKQMIDAEVINRFIAEQRTQGHNLSHMAVIIADLRQERALRIVYHGEKPREGQF